MARVARLQRQGGLQVARGPANPAHTTTGGAARVLAWLERWLQTEWSHLKAP